MGRKYGINVAIANPHGIVIPLAVELANPLGDGDIQIDPLLRFPPAANTSRARDIQA
jgi:hypothetical protein